MRFPRRLELAGSALAVAAAVLVWAVTRTYPNYDSYYHLVWGRELLDGMTPSFDAYAAPTKHPLYLGLAAVLGAVLGEGADRGLVLVCLLSHAALVVGVYRLGAAAFGRWAGLLGAVFAAASASFLLYAARGYVDMPFLALVVWASVLVAEGRRTELAFGLLALAGLLRPEAWVLSGLLWLALGRRWRLLPLVLAAPVLWVLIDLIATGDPLHSLHATSALAEDLGRERGLAAVPVNLVTFLGATVRPPVAALAIVGAVLAVRVAGWGRSVVPLAMVAAGVATFVATGVLGLSILPRYLTVPAVALCVLAGYALAGFTTLPAEDPRRRTWARLAAAAAILGVAGVAILAPSIDRVREEVRFLRDSHDSLVALLDDRQVRADLRCGPLTFPNYRLVPDARWHLDARRDGVGARSARRRDRGVAVFALTPKGLRRFGLADGASPLTNIPDPGFERIAGNERFAAYARCPGGV
jgi:hypothetical protein